MKPLWAVCARGLSRPHATPCTHNRELDYRTTRSCRASAVALVICVILSRALKAAASGASSPRVVVVNSRAVVAMIASVAILGGLCGGTDSFAAATGLGTSGEVSVRIVSGDARGRVQVHGCICDPSHPSAPSPRNVARTCSSAHPNLQKRRIDG